VKSNQIILLNRGKIAKSESYAKITFAQCDIYNIIKCVRDIENNNSVDDNYVGEDSFAILETI